MAPDSLTNAGPGNLLRELFAYSEYMRERFSMLLLELPQEKFLSPLRLPWMFENIRDLFRHLVESEEQWLGILRAAAPPPADPARFTDTASTVRAWEAARKQTLAYLAGLTPEALEQEVIAPFHGKPRLRVRQVLTQLLLHEVHHRGQITAALRMQGVAPPPSDFYDFVAEQLQ